MSHCSRCGAVFACAMVDDKNATPCWCTQLPALPMPAPGTTASCYCPQCLRQAVDTVQAGAAAAGAPAAELRPE
jgi:hypothetical protein